jgi:Kef-type K+ transport system membrane component KefB
MSGGDFDSVLKITLFCCCLFFAGQLCKLIKVSPIIGEIVIGVVLGPNAADLVPYESFFRLAGLFGVTLMIFESGLHVDFVMLKKVGLRATAVAIVGTLLPLATGMLLIMALDSSYKLWPVGLACGVTLAPTSVGMALKMLGEAKQLGEEYGQLIIAAAFIDDILSLVALTMLLQIGDAEASGEGVSLWGVFQPLVWSVLFCVGGAMLSYQVDRTPTDGFVKRILLRWVGFFPEFVPQLVMKLGMSEQQQAKALADEQERILKEYCDELLPKTEKIIDSLSKEVRGLSTHVLPKVFLAIAPPFVFPERLRV